jgi:hypothetical protein
VAVAPGIKVTLCSFNLLPFTPRERGKFLKKLLSFK